MEKENIPPIIKKVEIGICRRCGRKLKNLESIELGMGSTCYKKFMAHSILKPLFEVNNHEQSRTKTVGEAGAKSPKGNSN